MGQVGDCLVAGGCVEISFEVIGATSLLAQLDLVDLLAFLVFPLLEIIDALKPLIINRPIWIVLLSLLCAPQVLHHFITLLIRTSGALIVQYPRACGVRHLNLA